MEPREAAKLFNMLHYRYFATEYPVRFYSVEEAAMLLKVKPETVRSYIAAGEMGAEIRGDQYLISVDDLQDFLYTQSEGLHYHSTRRCLA